MTELKTAKGLLAVMEQSTGSVWVPAPPQKQPGADADTPPQRIATGRAISSNQSSAGDAVVARAVLCDLAAAASSSTAAGTHATSSWASARRMAEANAHSPQKRSATGHATSSNQSSLGETAVVVKAAQQVQSQAKRARWGGEVEDALTYLKKKSKTR